MGLCGAEVLLRRPPDSMAPVLVVEAAVSGRRLVDDSRLIPIGLLRSWVVVVAGPF